MPHTAEWKVRLHLFEDDDGTTKAHVVLDTGTTALTGNGTAHCHPADTNVPRSATNWWRAGPRTTSRNSC